MSFILPKNFNELARRENEIGDRTCKLVCDWMEQDCERSTKLTTLKATRLLDRIRRFALEIDAEMNRLRQPDDAEPEARS